MNAIDVEGCVRDVVGGVVKRDLSSLAADDDLVETLGIDSMQGLQILAGVEKRFDVRLPDRELIEMRTVGRIVQAVRRAAGEGGR